MATVKAAPSIFHELADLVASNPTREQLLDYHPSKALQKRASALLAKQKEDRLSEEEQGELDELVKAEFFVRLVKAKVRTQKTLPR